MDETAEPVDVVEEVANAINGALSPRDVSEIKPDTSMGELFLGLVRNPAQIITNVKGDKLLSYEDPEAGAEKAYLDWFNETKRRMLRDYADDPEALAGASNPAAIQAEITAKIISQLTALNGGRALSENAELKITDLLKDGPEAFAEAMKQNAEAVRVATEEHLRKNAEAKAAGEPEITAMAAIGILAVLVEKNADDERPNLDQLDVSNIDISPEGQTQASMRGAFEAMSDFVTHGNGSEIFLARLHGIDAGGHSGHDYSNWMAYDNINKIRGLHEGSATPRVIEEFVSDDGLSAAGSYSLHRSGAEGPANMDRLFTQALVDRGLVRFGEDGASPEEIAAAREDWNDHMADGLRAGLGKNPDHLMERMQKFANNRRDITMATEPAVEVEPVNEAEAVAAEAAVEVDDPYSAAAVDYYSADENLGPLVANTVEARIAQFESVPGFQAAMAAYQQSQTVPDFSPLAQLGSEPELGPRLEQ